MTLRHLKIFITVADLGSMTAASKALYISQPTVSQAVSELENYFGVKLFDRLSKRLYITEQGKALISYARHIIALYNEMEQAVQNQEECGILKIGASLTVGACLLPKLVNEFRNSYPSLQIKAVVKNTNEIENLIIQNDIDFAVVEGAVHTSDIISTSFMDDELVLACGRDHPLFNSKGIPATELSRFNFLLREKGSGTRELFENVMATHNIKWNLSWECNGSDILINAAINGVGVAIISKQLVGEEIQEGKLSIIKVNDIEFKRKFDVIYHKNKFLTNTMKNFIQLIKGNT